MNSPPFFESQAWNENLEEAMDTVFQGDAQLLTKALGVNSIPTISSTTARRLERPFPWLPRKSIEKSSYNKEGVKTQNVSTFFITSHGATSLINLFQTNKRAQK